MAKKKIQVTLDEARYDELARIAQQRGKKLAAVVRESIERYCLGPEAEKARKEALEELFALEAPAPDDYAEWKREYSRRKASGDDEPTPEDRSTDAPHG
jgi:hypothetical protein